MIVDWGMGLFGNNQKKITDHGTDTYLIIFALYQDQLV